VPEAATNIMDSHVPDEEELVSDDGEKSIEEVLSLHYEGETYNHKENQQPGSNQRASKRRFVDRQPNAQRVTWSQDREEGELEAQTMLKAKRTHQALEDEMEDDGYAFETDSRPVGQSRRGQAVYQVTRASHLLQRIQPSPKRQRVEGREDAGEASLTAAARRRGDSRHEEAQAERESSQELMVAATQDDGPLLRTFQDEALQSSALAADDAPSSSYAFVKETARAAMMQHRPQNGPQQRQRWSIEETEALINLIDKYGCSWVTILKKGQGVFAETRDQVSLKDKARNIKVELLMYVSGFLSSLFITLSTSANRKL
jgi:hypothetical protein